MNGSSLRYGYVKAQHDGHVETVAMFEAYATGGDNARMKQFANEMLPTLKTHLDQVSTLK
jgi:putative membrane protein